MRVGEAWAMLVAVTLVPWGIARADTPAAAPIPTGTAPAPVIPAPVAPGPAALPGSNAPGPAALPRPNAPGPSVLPAPSAPGASAPPAPIGIDPKTPTLPASSAAASSAAASSASASSAAAVKAAASSTKGDAAPGSASADTSTSTSTDAKAEAAPRPPLPPAPPSVPLPWERHLEVGADALFLARPTSGAVHLGATLGVGAHLNWELFRHLRFTFYLEAARHALSFDAGALGLPGTITSPAVSTYMFGVRLSPTIPITTRARAWLTAGAGWGRFDYARMTARDPGQAAFTIPERSAYLVEVPLGIGIAVDLIPRWLSLQAELTGAFLIGNQGSAFEPAQAIDAAGKKRTIGVLPHLDASVVQSIGLSLLL